MKIKLFLFMFMILYPLFVVYGVGNVLSKGKIYDVGNYEVLLGASGFVEIYKYNGIESEIIVPSGFCFRLEESSVMKCFSVVGIGSSAFANCNSLKYVSFYANNTLEGVSLNAFENCKELISVSLLSNFRYIGDFAFKGCLNLANVSQLDGLVEIGKFAFHDCRSLEKLNIGENVKYIREGAFSNSGLTTIEIPSKIDRIEAGVFENCYSLMKVDFGDGVISIGASAFRDCYSLPSITIPASVMNIDDSAFLGCSLLTSVIFEGNPPMSVGDYAFDGVNSKCRGYYKPEHREAWKAVIDENGMWNGLEMYMEGGYIVRFNPNGDNDFPVKNEMAEQVLLIDEEQPLAINLFERDGFDFGGWATYPQSVVVMYEDGELVKNLAQEGKEINLYALWIPKVVKITFKHNSPPPVTTFQESTHYCVVGKVFQLIPWCGTTRDGIDFDGWYTDSVGGSKLVPGETRVPAVDTIYYGHWTVEPSDSEYDGKGKNYLVKFDANGGELIDGDEARVVASGSPIGTLPNATKDGCEFEGWYTAATNGIRVTESTIVGENVTYYAHWKECMDDGSDDGTGGGSENGDYIRNVTARQRFPWNGLVDIKCDVVGVEGSTNEYKFVVAAVMPDSGEVREVSHIWTLKNGAKSTNLTVTADGNYRLLWDAEADLGQVRYSNMVVRVTLDVQNKSIPDKVQLWEGGPYWATTNIGAENPEDYGYYFWWGDTVGYKRENDKWVASDGSNSNFSFNSSNTPTDNKNVATLQSEGWITPDGVLAPEHDAAQAHWGGDWRMPTKQELEGLNNNCDWTWMTMNGVNGYVVRGRGEYASNSIFLPCAGYGNGPSLYDAGSFGSFWSSVPRSDTYNAWSLGFDSGRHRTYYDDRRNGRSVRPLQGSVSAPTNVSATDGTSTANVTVIWSAVTGAASYEIWRGTSSSSSSATKIGTSSSTSYSDTSATPGTTYYYWVKAVASAGTSAFSSSDSGYVKKGILLPVALDIVGSNVSTGGDEAWLWQDSVSYDMIDAAQSGDIADGQTSWMEVVVKDVHSVSFWWKVSSEANYDKLHFYVDGNEVVTPISGQTDWIKVEYALTSGSHTLKWAYTKDGSVSNGDDCGWVDSVVGLHEKVQLWEGGAYWATTNIGAEKPEDYGYYFWWGDTVGYKRENDAWVASDGSSSNFSFTSDNLPTFNKDIATLQSEGWITADGVLAPVHDAAREHWGGDWRMPTTQELDDLISKCDWTWTTMTGVNGYVVRGRGEYASNSIFLPCAGYGYETSLYNAGSGGDFWSSVPRSDSYVAWHLDFRSGGHGTNYSSRFFGQSVRPLQGFTK